MADPTDEELRAAEREIRQGRSFSLAEGIGRLAGPGGMKGGSPASRVQAAQGEVDRLVRRLLPDHVGVLARVLVREAGASRELLDRVEQPADGLRAFLAALLASEALLAEFVRMVDMEWGQVVGERPRFELDGAPPQHDDPYTIAAVRGKLARLAADLPAA